MGKTGKPGKQNSERSEDIEDKVPFEDKVLSASLERIDKVASFISKGYDRLSATSKEILLALWKCLGDGTSKIYKPASIYLEGKAKVAVDAYKIERLAEAKAKADLIRTDTEHKKALINSHLGDELALRARARFINQELFRQLNLDAIIAQSIQLAEEDDSHRESKPIDEAWMWRFIELAQNVSEDSLRQFWALILKGEANGKDIKPITLETLRIFNRNMADEFKNVVIFIKAYGYFVPDAFISASGVDYQQAEFLVDIGVLKRASIRPYTSPMEICDGEPLDDYNVVVKTGCRPYELTAVGWELAHIVFKDIVGEEDTAGETSSDPDQRDKLINLIGIDKCVKYIENMVTCFALDKDLRTVKLSSRQCDRTENNIYYTGYYDTIEIIVLRTPLLIDKSALNIANAENKSFFWADISEFYNRLRERSCHREPQ